MESLTEKRNDVKRMATWVVQLVRQKNPHPQRVADAVRLFRNMLPKTAEWDDQKILDFCNQIDNAS